MLLIDILETKRQLDVIDKHLEVNEYFCSNDLIADIAIWLVRTISFRKVIQFWQIFRRRYYKNVLHWAKINSRPAVKRVK